ncbi:MAG: GNAT family N-acetyltransferase [Clostridia bacterium]|nr:GNAT family N-acetyltransferase [Clostridia bacterium]
MLWKKNKDAVRPAKKKDLERVNALRTQLLELRGKGRPDFFQKPFGDEMREETRRMLFDKEGLLLVAETDDTVNGYVFASFVRESATILRDGRSFCKVEEICVDKACRGQGIGTLLIEALNREVIARGFPKLELNVWAFNSAACAFWTKQGFTPFLYCMERKVQTEDTSATN